MTVTPYAPHMVWLAMIPRLLWLVGVVVTIAVIVAIFQIRTATRRVAERLDDIYRLLKEQNKS
ncbi:MAG: hypothetical protein K6T81_14535 [Alicyclobacillus macrosporangiidus]|uniref:hypothetical protein n=1 Tax=Alicyclobacillus macrosporangiidus TaxID=392015 RepID=UPI0026F2060C|nr:hypothetical protein [Alicyclobacillus macrosporangiidus]MCL6599933.1 hypothetical protein [Alicyclobacillus macrosporangiidus]